MLSKYIYLSFFKYKYFKILTHGRTARCNGMLKIILIIFLQLSSMCILNITKI